MSETREECGIFAAVNSPNAAQLTYMGLYALQHRGQASAGIATVNNGDYYFNKAPGLVSEVFRAGSLNALPGKTAIGHVRFLYDREKATRRDAQPLVIECGKGTIGLAYNGYITNVEKLRTTLQNEGAIFQTKISGEVLLHLIARSKEPDLEKAIIAALNQVEGAYSLVFLINETVIAVRGPSGVRPLCIGEKDDSLFVASESCALSIVNASYIREVEPGEMVILSKQGVRAVRFTDRWQYAQCSFEYIYFSRPDSRVFGQNVYAVRKRLGEELAKEQPVDADIVISVPDSGNCAALGYASVMRIPYDLGLIRNHYVENSQISNEMLYNKVNVRMKFNVIKPLIAGKRVCVVDDSIIHGNTSKKIVRMLYAAGAKEVHLRYSAPKYMTNCVFRTAEASGAVPIAADYSIDEMKNYLGVDSLGFLSIEGMLRAFCGDDTATKSHYCTACFELKKLEGN